MNDSGQFPGAARETEVPRDRRLGDLPFVFLSYDEPWANEHWRDLKKKVPHAVRVHGVKGLDACHKAAAQAVPGDWVVTVDADTIIDAALPDVRIPGHLFTDHYRIDWASRHAVNGLWTGNGGVKIWPKRILRDMRTHEAVLDDRVSIDHDVGNVLPTQSQQFAMPNRLSETRPAKTALHAFRAGFREAVFLYWMAREDAARRSLGSWQEARDARTLRIWCSLGRHAENGLWVLYGARLGLYMPVLRADWDPRLINDYSWLTEFWNRSVAPRYGFGGSDSQVWNWSHLDIDTRNLALLIGDAFGFVIDEFDAAKSQVIAQADVLSASEEQNRHDALGYKIMRSTGTDEELTAARQYLEVARMLDKASAFDNIGCLHRKTRASDDWSKEAFWNFQAAAALGNSHAAGQLESLRSEPGLGELSDAARPAKRAADYSIVRLFDPDIDRPAKSATTEYWIDVGNSDELTACLKELTGRYCLIFDPGTLPGPAMERHVPDPALCPESRALGYACYCKMTGAVRISGVRFASVETFLADPLKTPSLSLPTILGIRSAPQSAAAAIRAARKDAAEGAVSPELATLGRDVEFGDDYVAALLTSLTGKEPAETGEQQNQNKADLIVELSSVLELATGRAVPLWSVEQSRDIKDMLPKVADKRHWMAAAATFASLENIGEQQSRILSRTAEAIWGK